MTLFDKLFEDLIIKEGGYSDHPSDAGGKTQYGITIAVAREQGYNGDMRDLTKEQAKSIYKKMYWIAPKFDRVALISEKIAGELFDTGVNAGTGRASLFLQQSLNVLNRQERDFKDVKEDRIIGPATLEALSAYLKKRGVEGETVLYRCLNGLQFAHYFNLARNRRTQEDFFYGWVRTRIS